ncbi:MAG: tRNA threonylcarbamoyladenosine dehydratase [Treponema sp.]|nr:tRNA threonylcarbamoyladenosine dehydratase [Treponema sp.]
MLNEFSRAALIFGNQNIEKLNHSSVIIFGLGGVGSYAAEALARTGVGNIDIVDNDTVSITNINRQLYALHSTIGKNKTDIAEERILDINPACTVNKYCTFFSEETAELFDFTKYDYIIDCIDTVSSKILLVMKAKEAGVPIISSMGAGNKIRPELLEVSDIFKTKVCPLARIMRRELKQRGIKKLKVVYSTETPVTPQIQADSEMKGNSFAPGSCCFVPPAAGLLIAREAVCDITGAFSSM